MAIVTFPSRVSILGSKGAPVREVEGVGAVSVAHEGRSPFIGFMG